MATKKRNVDVLIIGAGIAGITAALELLDSNKTILLLDRDHEENLGGLAKQAFGGMALCGTGIQRLNGIRDSADLMLKDWLSFADFAVEDKWPRLWAEAYCERNFEDIYVWLKRNKVTFFPAVNWVERGEYRPGNSVPRYHLLWGTGWQLVARLTEQLFSHRNVDNLELAFQHKVEELVVSAGRVVGAKGVNEAAHEEFEIESCVTVIASGGINGNIEKVRQNWPSGWPLPDTILNGSHQFSDGMMHDATAKAGGNITHLDWQWNYAAGIRHPNPSLPDHGLSLIPPKSALWLDAFGRRIGPRPMVTGFDTHELCERVSALPMGYSWQIMNRKIARKEISISGSEHNPAIRDRKLVRFIKEIVLGNDELYDYLVNQCPDVVVAANLSQLADKMTELSGTQIDKAGMEEDVRNYDMGIRRGSAQYNDDQLRRIQHVRSWKSDRLRTLNAQPIEDPKAGPLIAIREFIISRKSMGGIQTDLHSRVMDPSGHAIDGLYAVGEAAGFGGGGANGKRALEGTFLSSCILSGRIAARSILGATNP